MNKIRHITIFLLLFLPSISFAQRIYRPEDVPNVQRIDSTQLVSDEANLLSNAQKEVVNLQLRKIRSTHSVEFAVVTLPSIGDTNLEDFSLSLARRWSIGKKKKDNGLLLLVVLDIKRVRFETGYGLEGYLPDARLSRIINNNILPSFKSGNYAEGLMDGVMAVRNVLDGTYDDNLSGESQSAENGPSWGFILWGYCIIMLLVSLAVLNQLTSYKRSHPQASAVEEYEFLRKSTSILGILLTILFFPGGIVVFLVGKSRQKKLKELIKICPRCHKHTVKRLTNSIKANTYLTPSQQMENELKSRKFNVYVCSSCDYAQIISNDSLSTTYKKCPTCGTIALRYMGEKHISTSEGRMIQKTWKCLYCGENHTEIHRDNSDTEAAVAGIVLGSLLGRGSRGGGFGGGFGGGSFGGGGFGGGGASGGW